jgi:hypothetical protein
VRHDDVTAQTRKHFVTHGVVIVPSIVESETVRDQSTDTSGKVKTSVFYKAKHKIDFVNVDNPTDLISMVMETHGVDTQDKATGKALSMAVKNAVLKLLMLETGEEEESRFAELDLDSLLDEISAATAEGLKDVYVNAIGECRKFKDKTAEKTVISGYRKRKEELGIE